MVLVPFVAEHFASATELIGRAMDAAEEEYSRRSLAEHISSRVRNVDDGRQIFVWLHEGMVCGITGLHQYAWGPTDLVWLSWFAIDPEIQGRGWGWRLLLATVELARAKGYRRMMIETYSSDVFSRARRFYERQGFRRVGTIRGYLSSSVHMVVYGKRLDRVTSGDVKPEQLSALEPELR